MKYETSFLTLVVLLVHSVAQKLDKIKYIRPEIRDHSVVYLLERFDQDLLGDKWIVSKTNKSNRQYDGEWRIESSRTTFYEDSSDTGLVLKSPGKHHAISTRLQRPFQFDQNKPLVLQYEVKFQNALICGGAYVKLLTTSENTNLESFHEKSNFSIMFGPDKCGNDRKLHFIVCYKNPRTGGYEEKSAHVKPNNIPRRLFADPVTHLFTLVLKPDNSFSLYINKRVVASGNLLNDLTPPINPSRQIPDPTDRKPDDWDDRERVADVNVIKPDDWDERMNGEWVAPLIDNPNYRGPYVPRLIENPDWFEDLGPFKSLISFDALGLELWSMNEDIYFDNFLITDDHTVAERFAQESWYIKRGLEDQAAVMMKSTQDSLLTTFLHAAEDMPWLWGLIFLAAFCVSAVFYFSCSDSNSSSSRFKIKPRQSTHRQNIPAQSNDQDENDNSVISSDEHSYLLKRNRAQ